MDDISLKDTSVESGDVGISDGSRAQLFEEAVTAQPRWRSLFAFTNRRHTVLLSAALIFSFLGGLITPIMSILIGGIFSAFSRFGSGTLTSSDFLEEITGNAAALTALGVSGWVLNGAFFSAWVYFGEVQARTAREKLFDGLAAKEIEWYDGRKDGVSALISHCQTQVKALQMGVSQPLGYTIQAIVTAIASLGLAFHHSWSLTFVIMATLPVGLGILSTLSTRIKPHTEEQIEHLSEMSRTASRAITAIDTVKAFNGQKQECDLFTKAVRNAACAYRAQAQNNALQISFVAMLTLGMFVQGFWYGSKLVDEGASTAEDVMTTFWSCLMAAQALQFVTPQMTVLEKGCIAGTSLEGLLTHIRNERSVGRTRGHLRPSWCKGEIEFKSVSFAYPSRPSELALDDTTFFIPAKETTYIIGASGSGKSTIGNLILNIYQPLSGTITIDGTPLPSLDPNWLKENISLLPQDSVLFDETILRNIAFGKAYGDASTREIRDACEMASFDPLFEGLPGGLETMIGKGGNQLSGGQRQRVALARDRIRNANILIIDEAMSALDCATRWHVIDAVREWRHGKTTIIITHGIGEIRPNDYMYVLEEGKIAQHGYHRQLEQNDGAFRSFTPEHEDYRRRPSRRSSFSQSLQAEDQQTSVIKNGTTSHVRPILQLPQPGQTLRLSTAAGPRSRRASVISQNEEQQEPVEVILLECTGNVAEERYSSVKSRQPHVSTMDPPSSPLRTPLWKERVFFPEPLPNRAGVSLSRIFSTLWPSLDMASRLKLIGGTISAFLHAAFTPLFSFALTQLLASLLNTRIPHLESTKWSFIILTIAISDGVCSYLTYYLLECVGQSWVDYMRIRGLARILSQPRNWFDEDRNSVPNITGDLEKNGEEMRDLVGRLSGNAFVSLVMILIGVSWSFAASWRLTLVGLIIAPAMYATSQGLVYVSDLYEEKCNDAAEAIGTVFQETIGNISTVRNFSLEEHFKRKFMLVTEKALDLGAKKAIFSGIGFGLSDSAILFATALIFYYGAVLASRGTHSIDDVLLVFTVLLFSLANANGIVSMIPQLGSSKDTARRVLRLAHLPLTSPELNGVTLITAPGIITFHSVSFSYVTRPEIIVLRNISLSIHPNEFVALVGHSGCGKSTLVSLLNRLHPATTGTITFASHPLQSYSVSSLRCHLSIVPQSPLLFPCSILENIAYGMTIPPSFASVKAAAEDAGIHDFIAGLPDGYDTILGDNGGRLSGGQRQRVAIARALVRRPQVLVMDEGTSSLDPEGRKRIRGVLRRLVEREGRTVIAVTHEVEMMRAAQRCVVMRDGSVVEEGSFGELVAREEGELRRLVGDVL